MDALSIGSASAVSAIRSFDQAAAQTVRDAAPQNAPSPNGIGGNGDLAGDIVQQIQAQAAFQASVSVIRTADQMTGRVLDVKA
ncbi:MAG TPA: flagellar basal body rod C-terminal domain-containing protein [Asticcacaulis sp.]|jgi:hypothetical protein